MDKSTTESSNIVAKIRQLMEELADFLERLRQLEEELIQVEESNNIVATILEDLLNELPIENQENYEAIESQPSDDSDEENEIQPTPCSLQVGQNFNSHFSPRRN